MKVYRNINTPYNMDSRVQTRASKEETEFLDKSSKTIDILPVFFEPK